ncbi:MAG: arginine--tRNA ligase [Actinomycetota bacterium]|nr:arginine--tRNA ligase [Actinomycetota bacterium]
MPPPAPSGPAELTIAFRKALADAGLPDRQPAFERPRQREHGDWATNIALTLAKPVGRPPREVAATILEHLAAPDDVERVEIAGPGFINLHLSHAALEGIVRAAVRQGASWGRKNATAPVPSANVEFVSANPTGPLHAGHGRQAVLGDAIANLLDATGWKVTREYYFNDAGTQMRLFGESVAAATRGEEPPEGGYRGAYIAELAAQIASSSLDSQDVIESAYQSILQRIVATLQRLGVDFDEFFGERTLHESGALDRTVERLRTAGHVYETDGATWLRTTSFGDDKDRVLIRSDGTPTYFAADCAYLAEKFGRGYDRCIFVWGADHHGYVGRLKAVADAEGIGRDRVEFVVHQFVNLFRDGQPVRMSKRTGDLVTFDELIDEVGPDAARYTFLRFSSDVTIDFDIAEVVRQDRENPVYYVHYSHARIAGIMRTATERGVQPGTVDDAPLQRLLHPTEDELVRRIGEFPEVVEYAAGERAPHRVARYAEELAEAFHRFYTECTVISDDSELTTARYWLCVATRQTLVNALGLLGVSAPERM